MGPKIESSCLNTEFLNMDFMSILRSPTHSLCKNGSLQKKTHSSCHDLQGPSHPCPDLPPSLLSPQFPCTLCTAILSGISFPNLLSGPCFLVRGQCSTCNRATHPRTICIEAGAVALRSSHSSLYRLTCQEIGTIFSKATAGLTA